MDGAMDCPQCSAPDVIEIEQTLPDGQEVRFFSCHHCEEKWWTQGDRELDLSQILEMVRDQRA
jgi:transposase-like protein